MRILLLGHGHFLNKAPNCLPFRTQKEWDALHLGNEVIMVDKDPGRGPIQCNGGLTVRDPGVRPTDYVWQVAEVDTAIKSISIVSSCDHGPETFEVSKAVRDYNGTFSFEYPKRVYVNGTSMRFAGEFNSYMVFKKETFATRRIHHWTSEYTGHDGVLEVLELPEEEVRAPSDEMQRKMRELEERLDVELGSSKQFAPQEFAP